MKKFTPFLFVLFIVLAGNSLNAQRYLNEIFQDVQVTSNIPYAVNISVITGAPALDTLVLDVYEPVGDTLSERPVVLYIHTGTFLPTPLNGATTGNKTDSCVVEICKRLARRGFVAVAMSYRLGWNPLSTIQEVRTSTIINAVFRGVQDGHTCIRYLNNTYQNGNPYQIDTGKVILFGQGSGGFISLQMAILDREGEFNIPKFIDPSTLNPYVDTSISGDLRGLKGRPINIPNHVGFSSNFHFAINLSGAMGDSSWLEGGEVPMVSFHVPSDPLTPYGSGAVLALGNFVVNVSGSGVVQMMANSFGNNDSMKDAKFPYHSDVFSTRANAINGGLEGLFPFYTNLPENAPWEWWDPNHPNHSNSILTNQNMSKAKAMAYIDTILGYAIPRMGFFLKLIPVGIKNLTNQREDIRIYPNPAANSISISLLSQSFFSDIEMFDLAGKMVFEKHDLMDRQYQLQRNSLPNGMYFINLTVDGQRVTRKVVFN